MDELLRDAAMFEINWKRIVEYLETKSDVIRANCQEVLVSSVTTTGLLYYVSKLDVERSGFLMLALLNIQYSVSLPESIIDIWLRETQRILLLLTPQIALQASQEGKKNHA